MARKLTPATAGKRKKREEAPANLAAAEEHLREGDETMSPLPPPTHNVPDDVILKHGRKVKRLFDALQVAKEAQQAANGAYRAALKDMKAAGLDPDAMRWVMNNAQRDPQELDKELRDQMRYARLMGLPIGSTLDLFEDARPPASHVDARALGTDARHDYFAEGRALGAGGKKLPDPLPYPRNSKGGIDYLRGYDDGQFENRSRVGKGK